VCKRISEGLALSFFFISYKRKEGDKYRDELQSKMDAAKLAYWTDQQLKIADEWKIAIDTHIEQSAGVIVIMTQGAMTSTYVTYEWAYGMGRDKPIIGFKPADVSLEDKTIHDKLKDMQYANFDENTDEKWKELIDRLKELAFGHPDYPADIQKALDDALTETDPDKVKNSIARLQESEDPSTIDALARLVEHKTPSVSIDAAMALAQKTNWADARAIVGLSKALRSNNQRISHPSIETLKNIATTTGDASAVQALIDFVEEIEKVTPQNPENREMIARALEALENLKAIDALPLFREHINDQHGRTRMACIRALGMLGDESDAEAVGRRAIQSNEGNRDQRLAAIQSLTLLGGKDATSALLQVLEHDNQYDIRKEAATRLKELAGVENLENLERLHRYERVLELQRAIKDVIDNIKARDTSE